MGAGQYVVGIDAGTESLRALVLDVDTGDERACASATYPHGVIRNQLPGGAALPPAWSLQHPGDYLPCLQQAVRQALAEAAVEPTQVVGLGIAATSATTIPAQSDGTPLCLLGDCAHRHHAWPRLWNDHASGDAAERLTDAARQRNEPFLPWAGGRLLAEWVLPRALQMAEEAPDVFAQAQTIVELGDWLIWQLTERLVRSQSPAALKAHRVNGRWPNPSFLEQVHPQLADFYRTRWRGPVVKLGDVAGQLTPMQAARLGLPPGIPVAAAIVDAHAAAVGCGMVQPGELTLILGTSICQLLVADRFAAVPGMMAAGDGATVRGRISYEMSQSGGGDMLAWFVRHGAGGRYAALREPERYRELAAAAQDMPPGAHGLLALDWLSGNRSVLRDGDLSGVLVGLTMSTRPDDIYRALLESLAFGTRTILEAYRASALPVRRLVCCGGLAVRNPLLMQIMADVTGHVLPVVESCEAAARGAALWATVARGRYADIDAATAALPVRIARTYEPRNTQNYDSLYALYCRLHDHFGRHDELLHDLGKLQRQARAAGD